MINKTDLLELTESLLTQTCFNNWEITDIKYEETENPIGIDIRTMEFKVHVWRLAEEKTE